MGNNRLFVKRDTAAIKLYKTDSTIRKVVNYFVQTVTDAKISIVDFEITVKLALYFLENKATFSEWERLNSIYKEKD